VLGLVTGVVLLSSTKTSYDTNDGQFTDYDVLRCGNALTSHDKAGYELLAPAEAADAPSTNPAASALGPPHVPTPADPSRSPPGPPPPLASTS
jgi:hypothetical protein